MILFGALRAGGVGALAAESGVMAAARPGALRGWGLWQKRRCHRPSFRIDVEKNRR